MRPNALLQLPAAGRCQPLCHQLPSSNRSSLRAGKGGSSITIRLFLSPYVVMTVFQPDLYFTVSFNDSNLDLPHAANVGIIHRARRVRGSITTAGIISTALVLEEETVEIRTGGDALGELQALFLRTK